MSLIITLPTLIATLAVTALLAWAFGFAHARKRYQTR